MEPPAKKTKLDTENGPNSSASQSVSSSYHGMFYHLRLGMVILLHSYNLHRKGTLPHLSITMEDREAGKFDDIVIRYASSTTPKGTIYIQAKHKLSSENTKPLTEGDFFTKKASSTPFSIPMYFRSYLDHYRPASNGSHAYLLCTNATIDDKMMQYFTRRHYDVSDILSFCDLINATCYSFKREGKFTALFKDLRRVSLEKLGKLLATHAKTGEEINSNDTLIRLYHNLIAMSVERVTSNVFRFKREFWTAHDATPMGRLRIIVEREYGKLPQNKPKEEAIQLTISNASIDIPNATANPGSVDQFCFEQIDRIIHQFCDEFLLVCGSKSESNLLSDAHELMPSWVRDRKGTFENLQTLLLEALRGEGTNTITLKQLKEKYIEVNANESFNMLRVLTQEHFQSVRNEYPFIELQIIKNEEARQQLKRRHLLLALVVMFDKDDRATLLSNKEQLEVARCLQKLAESNEKTGIVLGVRDDMPQFSHRIFAEYFAASWLHEHKHRAECVSFRQSESYGKRELSRVRDFFDRMIQMG
uniref:Uncharacterized protein n=1 Tax=Anopheles coluzzii TaxID=1518534 RepID=A0A8W7PHF5_ANOCL